ncbi:AMED_5909 family protein [Amycolatopsis sp. H20-H5]|uniref:AMED_5909 family protein n=1 Tax=Amycolatopsis sp. H20-H5 TaxID=3046309 RepID=UPI002DB72874|nr:AMED_5909 family protein [Amycolatopsis sp. H20-H5]MEC3978617.1 AMED_5909 family protein [Amycolatopsis sp. H20-H5]
MGLKRSGPRTLTEAHGDVVKRRPGDSATAVQWQKFHQQNKRVYQAVADIDRGHHHELLYWVEYEQRKVEDLTEQIRQGKANA